MSVIAGIPGFFQILSDGSVKRFPVPTTAASPHFSSGFKSKDIITDAANAVTARIYIPDTGDQTNALPVIVNFHGGGFCIGSTKWSGIHNFLGDLCTKSRALIVSVDYRLAPEHRIPAAYDDGYSTLLWLASNASTEPWLERADLSRVFLSGESAGGNIVHNIMIRVVKDRIKGVDVKGLMIVHPFFGSEGRVGRELDDRAREWVALSDATWRACLPEGADREHWACNFEKAAAIDAECLRRFPAVTVFVGGLDVLMERGIMYTEFLKGKGADEVEVVISEGQEHAFHVSGRESEATNLLQCQMADFVNQH